jgi:hypothetical protein
MIVIGLAIAALVISKTFMGTAAKGAVDWSTKVAGRATFGTAGWAGRRSFGWAGNRLAESDRLKEAAESRGVRGLVSRGLIRTGDKARTGSYDLRGTHLGGPLSAGEAYKGGYKKMREEGEKREEEYKEGAKRVKAERDAREAGKADRAKQESEYVEERTRGLRNSLDTLNGGGRIFLNNELFEGEGGKDRLRILIGEEEAKAREEARRIIRSKKPTEERMQDATRGLDDGQRNKASRLAQDLEKAMAGMIKGSKEATEEYAKIKQQVYNENNSIREYVLARQEMNEKDRAYGIGLARAERDYGEKYAAAKFFGFSDEARRSVAQKARKGKTPKDELWEAVQKGFEKGEFKAPKTEADDTGAGESAGEENKSSET